MKLYAIIVAGGRGTRMGTEIPKQFLPIGGKPVLMYSIETFYDYDPKMELIVVLPESQHERWATLCSEMHFTVPHRVVSGGETRFHSVQNGLALVEEDGLVAVHDGVRPFASRDTIDRCFRLAAEKGTAVPVVSMIDSLRQVDGEKSHSVCRDDFRMVQTPQVFSASLLKAAYHQPFQACFTDDASVVEAQGTTICLAEGNRENIKITSPFDLSVAELLCRKCTT